MVWKYIQGMGFHLIITVFYFFTPTHRFSIFVSQSHQKRLGNDWMTQKTALVRFGVFLFEKNNEQVTNLDE